MSYTLVVIDMQRSFYASRGKRVQLHCKREIQRAMDDGAAIIFVEYIGQGPTIPSLVKLTDDYRRTFFIRKENDDGSSEVLKVIKSHRLPSRKLKFVGVNTNCCVLDTLTGVSAKSKKSSLEVISKACNSSMRYYHNEGLNIMARMKRVTVNKE